MKRRTILIILGVVITILAISLVVFFVIKGKDAGGEKPTEIVELASIPEYGYTLEDRDTGLYKLTFEELKGVLDAEEVDYAAYAKLLSELYIIDLYTITNKMNQYDVGSTDFVLESAKESFELKVKDTIYKYIEDNSYGKRTQELPEVASIEASDAEATKVKVGNNAYDGYTVSLTWNYVKDLGYDSSAKVTLARIDKKLFVTNQSASD